MQDGSGLFEHIVTFNIKDTVSSYPRVGRGVNFIHRDICPLAFFFFSVKMTWENGTGSRRMHHAFYESMQLIADALKFALQ